MPITTTAATITRDLLALGSLNINDHTAFILVSFGGGMVTWDRKTVSSPWVDGDITVSRRKASAEDHLVIDILGTTQALISSNAALLVKAVCQDYFILTITLDGTIWSWLCEASDYTFSFDQERMHARRPQMQVSLRRSPVPQAGPI